MFYSSSCQLSPPPSITLGADKIQNEDILVLANANPGSLVKINVKMERDLALALTVSKIGRGKWS